MEKVCGNCEHLVDIGLMNWDRCFVIGEDISILELDTKTCNKFEKAKEDK